MNRCIACLAVAALLFAFGGPASAQEWARKMFQASQHDFGTVARGAKAEFEFALQNIYEEEVHIASVRTSCGCTTPRIVKDTLKTWEKGAIVAEFNTRSFIGSRSATLTVIIDRPYYAEVQLTVQGYIRSDVVFTPGAIEFGTVNQGTPAQQKVNVTYAGRTDWQIVDVLSANPNFEVELTEGQRGNGRVSYDMTVRLKPETPAGYMQDELMLVTNDGSMQRVPLAVTGRVAPALTVSPASLFLGVVAPGEKVTKQLVVRGQQPFRIVSVSCPDGCFEFQASEEAKALHFVPVTFTAGETAGDIAQKIQIATDLGGSGVVVECTATATVK